MMIRCMGCMEEYDGAINVCPHCGFIAGSGAEEATQLAPGTKLGERFTIGKVIGYGGFGVTYIGWDQLLEQKVAIKEYLPSEFSTRMPGVSKVSVFNGDKSQQFRDGMTKFVEEARHLAKFQNEDGIVKVYDSFEMNDTAYIVMEYLEGETLAARLKREGTIPEKEAVAMLQPVMESLNVVHGEGMLHRDIAPDNIFLTKDGEVKLIDFGASRYATTSHSRSLTVIIKPGYSPEEQYRSRGDQGPYTDVYALGATLYKMITGKTPPDAMERRVNYEMKNKDILPEPHKLTKKISLVTENALLNAMNVRIEDRTPDITTFLQELNSVSPAKRRNGKIKKIDLYRMPLWLKIMFASIVTAVIVVVGLLVSGVIDFNVFSSTIILPEGTVVVPYVEGKQSNEAVSEIEANKLLVKTAGTVESEYIDAGTIIYQTPSGGAYAAVNSNVLLTVSSGASVQEAKDGVAIVPFVIWDTKEDALEKLEKAGLGNPVISEEYDDNVEAGSVISQSIDFGTEVPEGTVIELVISKGPAPFSMPNVIGKDGTTASQELEALGLIVTIEYRNDETATVNSVLGQSVAADTKVIRGTEIVLEVAIREETIQVPGVIGMARGEAERALKNAGFTVTVLENYDDTVAAGVVMSQTPAAGTAQRRGTGIVIYVSKGKAPEVPQNSTPNAENSTPQTNNAAQNNTTQNSTSQNNTATQNNSTTQNSSSAQESSAQKKTMFYMLSFDDNTSTQTMKVIGGSAVGTLPTPTARPGYTFDGWFDASQNQLSAGTVLQKATDTTFEDENGNPGKWLYYWAKWVPQEYVAHLDLDGGEGMEYKDVYYSASYRDTIYTVNVTKTGYTFQGWYTADGTRVNESDTYQYTSDQTFYAHWEPVTVKVQVQCQNYEALDLKILKEWTEEFLYGETRDIRLPRIDGYLGGGYSITYTANEENPAAIVAVYPSYLGPYVASGSIILEDGVNSFPISITAECIERTETWATIKISWTATCPESAEGDVNVTATVNSAHCGNGNLGGAAIYPGAAYTLTLASFSKEQIDAGGATYSGMEFISVCGLEGGTSGLVGLRLDFQGCSSNTLYALWVSAHQDSDPHITCPLPRYK